MNKPSKRSLARTYALLCCKEQLLIKQIWRNFENIQELSSALLSKLEPNNNFIFCSTRRMSMSPLKKKMKNSFFFVVQVATSPSTSSIYRDGVN